MTEYFNEGTPYHSMKNDANTTSPKHSHKELKINDSVYALYIINNNHLYLHMLIPLMGEENKRASENMLVYIIQCIEKVKFHTVSYLNTTPDAQSK